MSFFKDKTKLLRNLIIGTFITVPIFSSAISTVHLIELFSLGNTNWISILLALTFEIGSIASFLVLTILDKIKKSMVWFIFSVLSFMQIIGNIYYSFDYINNHLKLNPQYLDSFTELFSLFLGNDISTIKVFLACLIAVPIPLISLSFLKSLIDYVKDDEKIEPEQGINELETKNDDNKLIETTETPILESPIDNTEKDIDNPVVETSIENQEDIQTENVESINTAIIQNQNI